MCNTLKISFVQSLVFGKILFIHLMKKISVNHKWLFSGCPMIWLFFLVTNHWHPKIDTHIYLLSLVKLFSTEEKWHQKKFAPLCPQNIWGSPSVHIWVPYSYNERLILFEAYVLKLKKITKQRKKVRGDPKLYMYVNAWFWSVG